MFKKYREHVLKRHLACYHFNVNNLNDKEGEEFFNRQKTILFRKIKRLGLRRGNF